MSIEQKVFKDSFDFRSGITSVKEDGYFFAEDVLDESMREALEKEAESLPLEEGSHVTRPINAGKPNEVRQQHERLYLGLGDIRAPVANIAIISLTNQVKAMTEFPELASWQPTEIGYQRYRHSNDFIGAHRDRKTDRLLSITLTITGSAPVKIFEPRGVSTDYSDLTQTDEFVTTPGSVMLLRAPGLGNGEQVVHQVLPPADKRVILNLRDRPTLLGQPSDPKWQK